MIADLTFLQVATDGIIIYVCVRVFTPSSYLSGCQGNKVIDSKRGDLSKQADDDPAHLVTRHSDVKKHLETHTSVKVSNNRWCCTDVTSEFVLFSLD